MAERRGRRDRRRGGALTAESLPVPDIGRFDRGGERRPFLGALRRSPRTGVLLSAGHGVASELIGDLRRLAERYFALTEPDKTAVAMVNVPHFRCYNRAGLEHTYGKRERIDVGPERQAARKGTDGAAWTRLQGSNQWPDALPYARWCWIFSGRSRSRPSDCPPSLALDQPEDVLEPVYAPEAHQSLKVIR